MTLALRLIVAGGVSHQMLLAATPQIDEAVVKRIREEAIPAWNHARELTTSLQLQMEATSTDSYEEKGVAKTKVTPFIYKYTWDADRHRRLVEYFGDNTTVVRRIVVNPKYRFFISQLARDGPWIVNSAKADTESAIWDADPFEAQCRAYIEAGYAIEGVSVESLLATEQFHLERVGEVADARDGHRVVEVVAVPVAAVPVGGVPAEHLARGTYRAIIDPSKQWAVVSGSTNYSQGVKRAEVSLTVNSQLTVNGAAFPKRLDRETRYFVGSKLQDVSRDVVQYSAPSKPALRDEEFYLEHYGLTDAILSPTRPWFIIALNAVAAIALCLLFLLRRRRHASRGQRE